MGGKERWQIAIAGTLLVHIVLFAVAGAFRAIESVSSRESTYVEITLAEVLSPVGQASDASMPVSTPNTPNKQQAAQPDKDFPAITELQSMAAAPVNGNASAIGKGAETGNGTGPGQTRGPRVIEGIRPDYPENARIKGWEGTVKLQILVNTEGRVEEVRIMASSGYNELDQAAQRAVRSWRFSPALQKGSPVAAWATLPVVFDLR